MKHNLFSFVIFTFIHYILSTKESMEEYMMKHRHPRHAKKERPVNLDIPDQKVYFQGWVKYYHYPNETHYLKPPSLFQNNAYFHQRIPRSLLNQKDGFGFLHIPNKASFFMIVYNETIGFFSSRNDQLNHLVDNLKIENIRVIPEDDILHGGIRDNGNFPFGYCIEIVADVPSHYSHKKVEGMGNPETWIVCSSMGKNKDLLISTLIKLKVKHQRLKHHGMKITTAEKKAIMKKKPGIGSLIANPLHKPVQAERSGMGKLKDGYWLMLQDWTTCSRKCGGGKSYQQWMCVPPKNGGRPCIGLPLRIKKCNTHGCPSVNSLLTLIKKSRLSDDPAVAPKPIVKAGVFSNRPQRYSKCVVRENDAFIMAKVQGSKQPIRKPIRVIMNNMTVSIFNDDHVQELHYAFDLQKTKFIYSHTHCCFILQDNWRQEEFCGYNEFCGPKDKNVWVDGWNSDFKLFKVTCKTELSVNSALNNLLIKQDLDDELHKKSIEIMDQVKYQINILY